MWQSKQQQTKRGRCCFLNSFFVPLLYVICERSVHAMPLAALLPGYNAGYHACWVPHTPSHPQTPRASSSACRGYLKEMEAKFTVTLNSHYYLDSKESFNAVLRARCAVEVHA